MRLELSPHWSYNLKKDPKRFAFVMSRYKFANALIPEGKSVIEFGCSEGIGIPFLSAAKNASYLGIDFDQEAIQFAEKNWAEQNIRFICKNFLGETFGTFDVGISLDVIEHIEPELEDQYFSSITHNLSDQGMVIIGTPNVTSTPYASEASQIGHVNMYSQARLKKSIEKHFQSALLFGMNDEVVHTGYAEMCHYIFGVGLNKKVFV